MPRATRYAPETDKDGQKFTGIINYHKADAKIVPVVKCLHIDPQYVADALNMKEDDDYGKSHS